MDEYKIRFNFTEQEKESIINAETDRGLRDSQGCLEVLIGKKDITKGTLKDDEGADHEVEVGEDYSIPFAIKWMKRLPEILDGRRDGEPTTIECDDTPYEFYFKRKADVILCNVFCMPEEKFLDGGPNYQIPIETFCKEFLTAMKELGDLIEQSDVHMMSYTYNDEFEPLRQTAIRVIMSRNVLDRASIESIYPKEYIRKVLDFDNRNRFQQERSGRDFF